MALPLMVMVPFLFLGGVVFAYYLVLPNAIDFLQNFNDDNYDILLQAKDYYKFAITVLIAMGHRVPGADRDPGGHAGGDRLGRPAAPLAPLRDPRHRGPRDAYARPRSGDDAVADGPALRALRGLYPVGIAARPARCAQRRRPPSRMPPTTPNPDPCSLTSEAPADAGSSRSSTSRSPC